MSVVVLDLLNAAYRQAGLMGAPGRGISPEEKLEGTGIFNDIVDQWNAQRLTILCIPRLLFPVTAGQDTYEIGPTAKDYVIANRPPKIEGAGFVLMSNPAQPLELPIWIMTTDQWAQVVPVKTGITSSIATYLWYDVQFPIGYIHLWPTPDVGAQIALYMWTQIAQAVDTTTILQLAPGYKQALQTALAVEIRQRFGKPPDARLIMAADKSLGILKSANKPTLDLSCDPALVHGRPWNWYTGQGGDSR